MRPILIADDDDLILKMVERMLSRSGYPVVVARNGLEALQLFQEVNPALVILDIVMPRIDGTSLLKRIRGESKVPVLMLTGKSSVTDKVRELEHGADDYLTKPFVAEELLARVKALLRRSDTTTQEARPETLTVDGVTLDVTKRTLIANGSETPLTPVEWKILQTLMSRPGQVFSREVLLDRIYAHGERDTQERSIDQRIVRLRQKLREMGSPCVVTVRGFGYKFLP